jgi:hypothetical protein
MVIDSLLLDHVFSLASLLLSVFLFLPEGFSAQLLLVLQGPNVALVQESGAWSETFHGDWVHQVFDRQFVLTLPFHFDSLLVLEHYVFVLLEYSHFPIQINRRCFLENLSSMSFDEKL